MVDPPCAFALSEAQATHEAIEGGGGIGSFVLKAQYRARLFLILLHLPSISDCRNSVLVRF
jgi:hypothetical protein